MSDFSSRPGYDKAVAAILKARSKFTMEELMEYAGQLEFDDSKKIKMPAGDLPSRVDVMILRRLAAETDGEVSELEFVPGVINLDFGSSDLRSSFEALEELGWIVRNDITRGGGGAVFHYSITITGKFALFFIEKVYGLMGA